MVEERTSRWRGNQGRAGGIRTRGAEIMSRDRNTRSHLVVCNYGFRTPSVAYSPNTATASLNLLRIKRHWSL